MTTLEMALVQIGTLSQKTGLKLTILIAIAVNKVQIINESMKD